MPKETVFQVGPYRAVVHGLKRQNVVDRHFRLTIERDGKDVTPPDLNPVTVEGGREPLGQIVEHLVRSRLP
jgi:hypothetical protein